MQLHYLVICRYEPVLLTLMFYKVVQQCKQGAVGFFLYAFNCTFTKESFSEIFFEIG